MQRVSSCFKLPAKNPMLTAPRSTKRAKAHTRTRMFRPHPVCSCTPTRSSRPLCLHRTRQTFCRSGTALRTAPRICKQRDLRAKGGHAVRGSADRLYKPGKFPLIIFTQSLQYSPPPLPFRTLQFFPIIPSNTPQCCSPSSSLSSRSRSPHLPLICPPAIPAPSAASKSPSSPVSSEQPANTPSSVLSGAGCRITPVPPANGSAPERSQSEF